jgi:hypothetical protein
MEELHSPVSSRFASSTTLRSGLVPARNATPKIGVLSKRIGTGMSPRVREGRKLLLING